MPRPTFRDITNTVGGSEGTALNRFIEHVEGTRG